MKSLTQIPLFKSLTPAKDEQYLKSCVWREYGENELVIDIEEETTDVRFILYGSVRIIIRIAVGKEIILGEMGDGEFFGEIAAIDDLPRSANVTTLTNTTICKMSSKLFNQILLENAQVSVEVLKTLSRRIRSLNERLAEHSFLQAKYRLYSELFRLSKPRLKDKTQLIISPPPSQKEIAERIGTRREVVSRELNALEKQGHIEKTRGGIIILNAQELQSRITKAWST
ncbi:MAG: Crp/Fnr family transcriptional regulator [Nitratireductor sp.]